MLQQLVAFWSFGSVSPSPPSPPPPLPPSPISSSQTAIQPCQLWWEAGDCSVPDTKSESLCLDPPRGATLVMSTAALHSSEMKEGSAEEAVASYSHPCFAQLEFGSFLIFFRSLSVRLSSSIS